MAKYNWIVRHTGITLLSKTIAVLAISATINEVLMVCCFTCLRLPGLEVGKPSPILSPVAAFAFALCTQQGRCSDVAPAKFRLPADAQGRTLNSLRKLHLPVHPNL